MKHNSHDYEHFTESFREQAMTVLWTSLLTLAVTGAIIALALSTM